MRSIILILLASTLASGEDKGRHDSEAFAGCYESAVKSTKPLALLPKKFMLLNEPIKDERPWLKVRVLGVQRNDFRYRYSGWEVTGKDSLVVDFNSGTAGSHLKLARSGDVFMGIASESADAGGQEPFHAYEVSIRRIACP